MLYEWFIHLTFKCLSCLYCACQNVLINWPQWDEASLSPHCCGKCVALDDSSAVSGNSICFSWGGSMTWPVSMEYLLQVFPKCGMSELLLHITIDTKLRLGYFTLIGYTFSLFHRFNISEHMQVFEVYRCWLSIQRDTLSVLPLPGIFLYLIAG